MLHKMFPKGKSDISNPMLKRTKSSLLWKLATSSQMLANILWTGFGSNISKWPGKHLFFSFSEQIIQLHKLLEDTWLLWCFANVFNVLMCLMCGKCVVIVVNMHVFLLKNTLATWSKHILCTGTSFGNLKCILIFPNKNVLCSVPKFTKTKTRLTYFPPSFLPQSFKIGLC